LLTSLKIFFWIENEELIFIEGFPNIRLRLRRAAYSGITLSCNREIAGEGKDRERPDKLFSFSLLIYPQQTSFFSSNFIP